MAAASSWNSQSQPGTPSDASHETPKRRPAGCTPLIQVTWRANENDATDDGTDSSGSDHSKRRFQRAIPVHVRSGMTRASMGHLSLGGSSIGCCFSSSSTGGGSCGLVSSPRVQCPCLSSSSGIVESDLKGMHLTRLVGSGSEISSSATCSSSSPPPSAKLYSTPNRSSASVRPAFNPFEGDLIETMNCSSLSPSVFSTVLTPSKETSGMFSWGVENIAIMYPTEIEENPHQETPSKPIDPELEEKLQCAIDSFFAQKSFAPSPWLDSGLPKVAASVCSSESPSGLQDLPPSCSVPDTKCAKEANGDVPNTDKKDAWCQTVLTLPVDFDVEGILGGSNLRWFDGGRQREPVDRSDDDVRQEPSLSESRDGLSVSSLRRKLFVNYDENSVPIPTVVSPLGRADDPVFRLNLSPRSPDRTNTPPTTYTSPQFSSSPIVLKQKGMAHRATMTPPTDSASPSLSPVKPCNLKPDKTIQLEDFTREAHHLVDDDVGSAGNHDDTVSFMSMEQSLPSNTSMIMHTDGRRHHPHMATTDNMSVLQERADGCATVPIELVASSRMSFVESVQYEGDAAVTNDRDVFCIVASP